MTTLAVINQEKRMSQLSGSKSLESVYSSNSSSKRSSLSMYLRKSTQNTKIIHGNNGEVRQRVISARLHRMKSLQNQLGDAQIHIAELTNENRLLRTLHKRQDSALAKYECSTSELPHLLRSHAEEIRVAEEKCRNLQQKNKELMARIKQKDASLLALTDQNKHLIQLNHNKNLEEREKLTNRVRYLELRLNEKDDEIKVLHRRLLLEAKTFKTQLNAEIVKNKELCHKFEKYKLEPQIEISQFNKFGNVNKMIPKKITKLSPTNNTLNIGGDYSSSSQLLSSNNASFPTNKGVKTPIPQLEAIKHQKLLPDELKQHKSAVNDIINDKIANPILQMATIPPIGNSNKTKQNSIEFKDIRYTRNSIIDNINNDDDEDQDGIYTDDSGSDITDNDEKPSYTDEQIALDFVKINLDEDNNVVKKNSNNENGPLETIDDKKQEESNNDSSKQEEDISQILNIKKKKNNEIFINHRSSKNIDSQKKSKLLAALRAIDAKEY